MTLITEVDEHTDLEELKTENERFKYLLEKAKSERDSYLQ